MPEASQKRKKGAPRLTPTRRAAPNCGLLRIVVADDDPAVRRAVTIALQCDGHEVLEANDGSALLDIIGDQVLAADSRSVPVDLIITDVWMPGFTGLQALAAVRQMAWNTPCIVITAALTPDVEVQALRLGATAVFGKPVDINKLRTEVSNLSRRIEVDCRTPPARC